MVPMSPLNSSTVLVCTSMVYGFYRFWCHLIGLDSLCQKTSINVIRSWTRFLFFPPCLSGNMFFWNFNTHDCHSSSLNFLCSWQIRICNLRVKLKHRRDRFSPPQGLLFVHLQEVVKTMLEVCFGMRRAVFVLALCSAATCVAVGSFVDSPKNLVLGLPSRRASENVIPEVNQDVADSGPGGRPTVREFRPIYFREYRVRFWERHGLVTLVIVLNYVSRYSSILLLILLGAFLSLVSRRWFKQTATKTAWCTSVVILVE
jgi:hypothetical protein